MIKNCNDDVLLSKRIEPKNILLYQVWKELTEPRTLDTYQYRVINTLSGILELSLVLNQRLNEFTSSNHNIESSKFELRKIISQDTTLQKHYRVVWQRLLSHLGEKTDNPSQQRALRYQLDYCYNDIQESYFLNLVSDLEEAINNKENEIILIKAGQLVSCCITLGWSPRALNEMADKLCDSRDNTTGWEIFKDSLISRRSNSYSVYVPIKVKAKPTSNLDKNTLRQKFHDHIDGMGVSVKNVEEMKSITADIPNKYIRLETRYYLALEVNALDIYSASQLAIAKCSDVMSLLSFFNVIEAWDASELTWLVKSDVSSYFRWIKYQDLYESYSYLEGAHQLVEATKGIVAKSSSVQRKLRAAFSYANMGKTSSAQEEKFINTWVALESLCRGNVYDNIISSVLETVPPALCSRYIYQLYRNFIEDCIRCDVDFTFSSGALWQARVPNEERVKKIIAAFNDDNIYSELLRKCGVNTLLKCRCEQLYELATNNNKMIERIEQHYQNVRLQLSRLYRKRNEIAHNAIGADGSLLLYIEHLNDYLAGVVSEIIMWSERKNVDDIDLIFEIIKDNYMEFTDIGKSKKGANPQSLLRPLFETGIISLL